jgi:aspartyl-tRNA(Asn)/glutamyl-tRNA(Gln) amidotransferase subunit B
LNSNNLELGESKVTPEKLAEMIGLIKNGTISGKMAKSIFEKMFDTGDDPIELARAEGPQIRDEGSILAIVDRVVADQAAAYQELVRGDDKKFGFFVGQIMKASEGKANPQEANRLLRERLEKDRA